MAVKNTGSSASASASGGVGFLGLLTVAFIVLKLVGVISWPWIWVLSPLIFSVSFNLFIVLTLLLIAGIVFLKDKH
jgi:hypothetical protein